MALLRNPVRRLAPIAASAAHPVAGVASRASGHCSKRRILPIARSAAKLVRAKKPIARLRARSNRRRCWSPRS